MEVTGKVLREVEFRDRLRGYDTDEVDEFLEKVAVGVDALNARIEELETRLAAQPAPAPAPVAAPVAPAMPAMDDDAIRRTLVLAQRTADLAVSEAREEAARLIEDAKSEAEALVARAEEAARRLRAEAEEEVQARVARLGEERERLERDVRTLARMVEDERARLTDSLTAALRFVRDSLSVGDEAAARAEQHAATPAPPTPPPSSAVPPEPGRSHVARPEEPAGDAAVERGAPVVAEPPPPPVQPELPQIPNVEAEIDEDAASAAWEPRAEPGRGHVGRPRPMSAPSESADGDAEEALWERWAAGRDLGVVPGPADFSRRPTNARAERDRGWSA